eukprot:gene7139-8514_t
MRYSKDFELKKPHVRKKWDVGDPKNLYPIVLVHGVFGWGTEQMLAPSYWAGAESLDAQARILSPSIGPVSSAHDRAVELFYKLKGGKVDYGDDHSKECGHARFGEECEGLHSTWSEEHPVHFIGHSYGGNTILMLHHLLAEKFFPGHDTNPAWIKSVTTIASPVNGIPFFSSRFWGFSHHGFKRLSVLGLLGTRLLHLIAFLDLTGPKAFIDLRFDHWGLSWRQRGVLGGLQSLLRHDWAAFDSGDFCMDVNVVSTQRLMRAVAISPHVYYYSFTQKLTVDFLGFVLPSPRMMPALVVHCGLSILFGFPASLGGPDEHDHATLREWLHSDGVVPIRG